jgi:fructokinase
MEAPVRIGIDVGGTKIEGICLGPDGDVLAGARVATPRQDYDAFLDALAELVDRLEAAAPHAASVTASVGVGTPGFLAAPDGRIRNSNLAILNGRPVDRDLSKRLGRLVRVANDANCFVLSEATDGAAAAGARERGAAGPDVVFGATLGTGVGGGIVVDGRVLAGANGSAAEWSHTTLPFWSAEDGPGGGCSCGRERCIESYLAGRGLAWSYRRLSGTVLPAEAVADRANRGVDDAATAAFAAYESWMARALASVINLLDPRVIVLGGGVSTNARIYENVPLLWEQYTAAKQLVTRLVPARHGDASGVRGAAWLWPPEGNA